MSIVKLLAIATMFTSGVAFAQDSRRDCERRVEMQFRLHMGRCERTKMVEDRQCRLRPNFVICHRRVEELFHRCTLDARRLRAIEMRRCMHLP